MKLIRVIISWDEILLRCLNVVGYLIYGFKYKKIKPYLLKNKALRNRHSGERCFIILNGPSLKELDITVLADEQVFCVNHFYNTEYYDVVQPNYYCAIDTHFFDQTYLKDKDNYISKILKKTDGSAQCLFGMDYIKNFPPLKHVYLHYSKNFPVRGGIRGEFDKMVSSFGSVSLFSINAAIYMGFSEIYLLGYDFPPGGLMPHFYKNSKEEKLVRGRIEEKTDIYSIAELHWLYSRAQIEHYYIDAYANSKNVKIYNCNPNSYVKAFEFKGFNQIHEKENSL